MSVTFDIKTETGRILSFPGLDANPYYADSPEMFMRLAKLVAGYFENAAYVKMLNAGRKPLKKPRPLPYADLRAWLECVTAGKLASEKYSTQLRVLWVLEGRTDFPKCANGKAHPAGSRNPYKDKTDVSLAAGGYRPYCCKRCFSTSDEKAAKVSAAAKRNKAADPDFFKKVDAKKQAGKVVRGLPLTWNNQEKIAETRARHKAEDPDFQAKISIKIAQTNIKNGYPPTWNNREQAVKTRYGMNNGKWESDETVSRRKRTSFNNRGYESPNSSPEVKERKRQSCLRRFGKDHWWKTDESKQHMKDVNEERKKKECATKRKNGTFNSSKQEDKSYIALCNVFGAGDIVRQYFEDRYPFRCDFYIKSLDAFVECNFHWVHGKHAFDAGSSADTERLAVWVEKAKSSKFFRIAVDVWTRRDPEKFAVAAKNKLNYFACWNESEFNAAVKTLVSMKNKKPFK